MLSLPVIAVLALTTLAVHASSAKHKDKQKYCYRDGQLYEMWQCDACDSYIMKHEPYPDHIAGVCVPIKADFEVLAPPENIGVYARVNWTNFIADQKFADLRPANHSKQYAYLEHRKLGTIELISKSDYDAKVKLDHGKHDGTLMYPGSLHSYRFGCVGDNGKARKCTLHWDAVCAGKHRWWQTKYKPNGSDKELATAKPHTYRHIGGSTIEDTFCERYFVWATRHEDEDKERWKETHLILDDVVIRTFEKGWA